MSKKISHLTVGSIQCILLNFLQKKKKHTFSVFLVLAKKTQIMFKKEIIILLNKSEPEYKPFLYCTTYNKKLTILYLLFEFSFGFFLLCRLKS